MSTTIIFTDAGKAVAKTKITEALRIMTPMEALKNANLNGSKSYEILNTALSRLEELEKKETPMKVIVTPYKKVVGNPDEFYMGNHYSCDKCKSIILHDKWQKPINELKNWYDLPNYCPRCGVKLDWSDEK